MRRARLVGATLQYLIVASLSHGCSNGGGDAAAEPGASEALVAPGAGGGGGGPAGDPGQPGAGEEFAVQKIAVDPEYDPLREYDETCPATEEASLECEWLRSLVVADVVQTLEGLEDARDQRAVEKALLALDVLDEPAILIAGGRILGQFPDTPGLAEKALPLLDSPYHQVQRIGADLLAQLPEPGFNSMANKWRDNHAGVRVATPYDELPFPAAYDGMGFPEYPGAQRYTPADSDRSVGWWSSDPPSEVANRLAQTLGVEVMNHDQWTERSQQEMASSFKVDEAKMAEMESLMQQYQEKPDAELLERLEKLQQEVAAPMEQAAADADKSMASVATPTSSAQHDQIYYLIAEEKLGRVARAVLVYRQPTVERTVIQMSWNLRDYPPAWGGDGPEGKL